MIGLLSRLFRRKPAPEPEPEPWTPGLGWRLYYYQMGWTDPEAASHADVEVIREGWDAPILRSQLGPMSNVVGLWWRPLGPMIDVTPAKPAGVLGKHSSSA